MLKPALEKMQVVAALRLNIRKNEQLEVERKVRAPQEAAVDNVHHS